MPDIPSPLTYGTVVGHFTSILWDSDDPGEQPDVTTLNGTVTISPNVRVFRILGPTNYIAIQQNIVAQIINGVLYAPDGVTPLRIIASDSPGITPSPVQYTAKFAILDVTAQPANIVFEVPSNGTVDLAEVVSLAPAAGVQLVVSEESRTAAEDAAARADAALATLRQMIADGTVSAVDGREVSLAKDTTNILWRLGTDPYQVLIPIADLAGPRGFTGPGFVPRGTWATGTAYAVNDIVVAGGSTFRVKTAHTSSGTAPTTTVPGANYEVWAAQGSQGNLGPANTLSIGTVTTGAAGTAAAATITGTAPAQTLNLTIPRGLSTTVDYTAIYNAIGFVRIKYTGSAWPDRTAALTAKGITAASYTGDLEWYSIGYPDIAAPGTAVVGDDWWEEAPTS